MDSGNASRAFARDIYTRARMYEEQYSDDSESDEQEDEFEIE